MLLMNILKGGVVLQTIKIRQPRRSRGFVLNLNLDGIEANAPAAIKVVTPRNAATNISSVKTPKEKEL